MRFAFSRKTIVWTLYVLGVALSAAAQSGPDDPGNSRGELAAAVTSQAPADVNQPPLCGALALPCLSPRTMPDVGGALVLGARLTDHVALVGEAAVSNNVWFAYQTECAFNGGQTPAQCPSSRVNHVRTALAGARVRTALLRYRDGTVMRLFAQILVGPEISDVVAVRRAIQPGGGVDLYTRGGVTIRVEADYCSVPGGSRNLSTQRWLLGVVIPAG
jgi:hypothetical protein